MRPAAILLACAAAATVVSAAGVQGPPPGTSAGAEPTLSVRYYVSSIAAVDGETPESVGAVVSPPGGTAQSVSLGSRGEIEDLVRAWRAAVVSDAPDAAKRMDELARRLRERLLDPLLELAGDARVLDVAPDGILQLVPLDALPLEEGLVGERFRVRRGMYFPVGVLGAVRPELVAELFDAPAGPGRDGAETPEPGVGEATILGGVDYDAELADGELVRPRTGGSFDFLPETLDGARSAAAHYRERFGREPRLLTGAGATKAALLEAAPTTRFLHLATHGWLAAGSASDELRSPPIDRVAAFAPHVLCGVALAGANGGRDSLGRVSGILTAEELATADLRGCELAVLAASETAVGTFRRGQGMATLQSAAHAAGARAVIGSLWRVDAGPTRRLFERFWQGVWEEGLDAADALWRAKMELRAAGFPLRDWGGWVVTVRDR